MILLVDDDIRSLRPYCDELEYRGRRCRLVGTVDEAIRVLKNHAGEIKLLVFDMMMPSGKVFASKDLDGGLRTGEHFYREFRKMLPDAPAVLFTNRNVGQLDGPFRTDPRCECRMKEDLLPSEFADRVEQLIAKRARG